MSHRLALVRSPLTLELWNDLDRSGNAIACGPSSIEAPPGELLDRMVERRSMLIVCLEEDGSSRALSAALISDLFAIGESASIELDRLDPVGMAGLVWRIGRGAIPLFLMNRGPIEAGALVRDGIADVVVPEGSDPLEWIRSWLGRRSLEALSTAARLVRGRGGEQGERAEFARMFAAGVPSEGLSAFLERRPPGFEDELIVETI